MLQVFVDLSVHPLFYKARQSAPVPCAQWYPAQSFGIPLQCLKRIVIIPPGMGLAECAADIRTILIQRLISAEHIGNQCSRKTGQESLDIAPAPSLFL